MKNRKDAKVEEWLTNEIEKGDLTRDQRMWLDKTRQLIVQLDQYREAYLIQGKELNTIDKLNKESLGDLTVLMQEVEKLKSDLHAELTFNSVIRDCKKKPKRYV